MKFLLIFFQIGIQVALTDDRLVLVHLIARHGDRTPDLRELHPSMSYYNESNFAPYGYSQLTNDGKIRCYNVGKTLRRIYDGFLNSSYHYTLVEARSTFTARTKDSLQLLLAGLFPPTQEISWLDGMNWSPVATFYDENSTDKLLYPWGTERHKHELAKYKQTVEYKNFTAPFENLVEFVSEQIGVTCDLERTVFIARGFELAEMLNFTLPDWHKDIYPYPMKLAMPVYLESTIGTKLLKRIAGGYLLKKIVDETEMKIKGTLNPVNRKLFIYMAHDTTMSVLLSILEIWDRTIPSFGTYLALEVHNVNGTYGFKFFNFNDSSTEPQPVTLPGFGEFVTLEEFKIHKREFLQLDDLDEPSFSNRVRADLQYVFLLFIVILQLYL